MTTQSENFNDAKIVLIQCWLALLEDMVKLTNCPNEQSIDEIKASLESMKTQVTMMGEKAKITEIQLMSLLLKWKNNKVPIKDVLDYINSGRVSQ